MRTILSLLIFFSGSVIGQTRQRDTVKVIMRVCDTSHNLLKGYNFATRKPVEESAPLSTSAFWQYGYSVREKHNEREDSMNADFCANCNWKDYWVHLFYLDDNKLPLYNKLIVWMATDLPK